ncbi:hypothetical protein [Phaeobacter inhibens]|uniref:MSP1 EGF domain 1 n=1 Tax=Phaeobacter inhibens TaxID=221822 RepID=A0A2I7KAS3_9RHOB|nr:hypothetical protein [Phaeobacter inhibens]AUQ99707.1 hypothetical protein PhaeoP88_02352 [Phaeobacter inhibens]
MHRNLLPSIPSLRANAENFSRVMELRRFLHSTIKRIVVVFGLLAAFIQPAFSETVALSVPENAHKSSYGDGWECNRSYRAVGSTCIAVVVPQNAYPTHRSYGPGWECSHGFIEAEGASCAKVFVPEGGYLAPSGTRWNCLRGYRKIDDFCQKIVLPPDAYLTNSTHGPSWLCDRGFEAKGDACAVIEVPEHAFLNASAYGQRWTCERGYAVSGDHCILIELPENAHLARTGNRWECNKNFQQKKGRCVLNN